MWNYRRLQGEWLDDTLPYHVVHRIASYPEARLHLLRYHLPAVRRCEVSLSEDGHSLKDSHPTARPETNEIPINHSTKVKSQDMVEMSWDFTIEIYNLIPKIPNVRSE